MKTAELLQREWTTRCLGVRMTYTDGNGEQHCIVNHERVDGVFLQGTKALGFSTTISS